MKLTNYIRDAYINSVMNDVPSIDYNEQIIKFVTTAVINALPGNVKKLWNDPATQAYVNKGGMSFKGVYIALPARRNEDPVLPKDQEPELNRLVDLKKAQTALRESLRAKVKQAAYGCTTRKALVDLLPEFEKYLPAEYESGGRSLPVVANLMVDLVKAGWPKGGRTKPSIKPAATATA